MATLTLRAEWQPRLYTSNPPIYTPRVEWWLVIDVVCDEPTRVAELRATGESVAWRLMGGESRHAILFDEPPAGSITNPWRALGHTRAPRIRVGHETRIGRDSSFSLIVWLRRDTGTRRMRRWVPKAAVVALLPSRLHALGAGPQSGMVNYRQVAPYIATSPLRPRQGSSQSPTVR